jgi:hypothetical protein
MNFDEFEFEFETPQARPNPGPARRSPPPKPAPPPPLTTKDVQLATIDSPAQDSLLRIGADPKTRAAAIELLGHVKAGRIAAIRCQRSAAAEARANRLGFTAANAIRTGEDAVVLLDPNDLRAGAPIIAFRHDLDPRCANPKGAAPTSAQQAKVDAALLKAHSSFVLWRAGISLGQLGKCALAPLDDAGKTVNAAKLKSMTVLANVLPRLLCQPSAVPTTPGTPKLVRHRHVSFNCDAAFSFKADGPPIDLVPANMNPRFIMPDDSISIHAPLQTKLTDLIVNQFPDLIDRASVTTRVARQADKLHIAVVDLSGARKLCQPQFAGFGAELNEAGASTAKILLFYAAHQMQFDLQELVKAHGIKKAAELKKKAGEEWARFTCKPHFEWLFKLTESAGPLKVDMCNAQQTTMDNIVDEVDSTPNASKLILRLSFEYIASVGWQSGLRHPQRGGIWYGSTYCQGGGVPAPINGACHLEVKQGSGCDTNQSRVIWTNDPFGHRGVRGSALAYATYMTLLAQERLVDKAMSARIEALLVRACGFISQVVPGVRAQKCGLTSTLFHDAALVAHGKVRYAIAYMFKSKNNTDPLKGKVLGLVREIDKLIVAANP